MYQNRTRLECKAFSLKNFSFPHSIRIEPDWNVKRGTFQNPSGSDIIRIEPDWNVKCTISTVISSKMPIRIEPDWNVKKLYPARYKTGDIYQNRTRLECKAFKKVYINPRLIYQNRTRLECKGITQSQVDNMQSHQNRTRLGLRYNRDTEEKA